jgi:hypothetical protein
MSNNGKYSVTINLTAISINAPTSCQYGYNYTTNIQYEIVFSGSGFPSSLNTLQGYLNCNGTSSYFNLPNNGGSGIATTSNAYTNLTNCATVTPTTLNCNSVSIQIQGPGLGNQTVDCPLISTLPIELTEFKGSLIDNRKVELKWATATEKNNDFFTVERSKDGQNWEKLVQILGAGNSESNLDYNYIDETPFRENVSYYRIKQTDFNGDFEYSPIISINRTGSISNSIFLYPNPAKDLLTIEGDTESLRDIEIYTIDGKRIFDFYEQNLGSNSLTIEIGRLQTGTYLLKTTQGMHRFIKE